MHKSVARLYMAAVVLGLVLGLISVVLFAFHAADVVEQTLKALNW